MLNSQADERKLVPPTPTARTRKPKKRGNTAAEVFARSLKRQREPLSQAELAQRMTEIGHPMHQTAIAKIETGDRAVSLADALALAAALSVDPSQLLSGSYSGEKQVEITSKKKVKPRQMRRWLRGRLPLEGSDERRYWDAVSDEEARAQRDVRGLQNLRWLFDDYEEAAIDGNRAGMLETLDSIEDELRSQRRQVEQSRG
jgi:transcriptional regulator with XRE-family HTH domain